MALMNKSVEFRCINCPEKFKTLEEIEKHKKEKHGDK